VCAFITVSNVLDGPEIHSVEAGQGLLVLRRSSNYYQKLEMPGFCPARSRP